ncbi:MAG: LamG-like jellyroll fold domain-containing protein, partial [Nanoarchaeota archaeon]
PINATSIEISSSTVITSDVLLDLNFDTENINQTSPATLHLDGNENFVTIQNNSTDVLSTFTISAWIKPDYSNGSSEFTIISKENSFILSMNNNIEPKHTAKFSIFDGIKWTYVKSNSTIQEQWTHISTTFDGNSIKIYINGKLDATTELADTVTISVDGKLVESQVNTIYSNQDIVIGAYVSTNNGSPQSQNNFSGEIDAISIHNSIFDEQKLNQIYQEQSDYYSSLDVEISLEEIMQQIIQENVLATNSTLVPTNSTVTHLDLIHETIEIGKPAMWTQTIELSNKTDGITIELPEDAEITQVTTMEQQTQETLYKAEGIMNNADIKENQIINLRIENSTDPDQYDKLIASLDDIPEQIQQDKPTKLLVVNDTADQIEIKFETPAPYVIEEEYSTNSLYNKTVTVTHDSTLHYTNVISYSAIPEDLVSQGITFDLFWNINGTKMNVTSDPRFAVQFIDTNGNGIIDQMQWIVPQMSEQQFEIVANIVIINVQSYPVVGGNWEVRFTTNGTADLVISAINGTTFGESLPYDLNLLSIKCGENTIQHQWINGSIVVQNYTCNETGYETSHVLTPGKHHLEFRFGNSTGYANNNAFASTPSSMPINLPLGVATYNGNFIAASVGRNELVNFTSNGAVQWNSTSGALNGTAGIAINSTGYVYVADTGSDVIKIFNPSGVYSTSFGSAGSGNGQFTTPMGIAINSTGYVYVADTGND